MIDILLISVAFISVAISVFGFYYLNKTNSKTSTLDSEKIQLLREEKVLVNKRRIRKRKAIPKNIQKLSTDNQMYLHQAAKENRLSVGELILAAKINSLK